jgi:histidinol-phosphatase
VETAAALDLALALADAADAITMDRFRAHDLVVDTKPDLTPVSEADHAAEARIRELVADRAPTHAVAGEEFGDDGEAECRWIVDPIDGTKNYVRGVPIWATLLGFERAGELVVGVVSAPALGARWWAGHGLGAFRDGHRIQVSAVHAVADAHLSFAGDYAYLFDGLGDRLVELSSACWRTRSVGDFWQHVLVADGGFDVSIDPILAYWDAAALLPIITEAGGQWTTLTGERPPRPDSLVCTNGHLHEAVLARLTGESEAQDR